MTNKIVSKQKVMEAVENLAAGKLPISSATMLRTRLIEIERHKYRRHQDFLAFKKKLFRGDYVLA